MSNSLGMNQLSDTGQRHNVKTHCAPPADAHLPPVPVVSPLSATFVQSFPRSSQAFRVPNEQESVHSPLESIYPPQPSPPTMRQPIQPYQGVDFKPYAPPANLVRPPIEAHAMPEPMDYFKLPVSRNPDGLVDFNPASPSDCYTVSTSPGPGPGYMAGSRRPRREGTVSSSSAFTMSTEMGKRGLLRKTTDASTRKSWMRVSLGKASRAPDVPN